MNSFVSADRRATARTTTSLSHAAIRQKKNASKARKPIKFAVLHQATPKRCHSINAQQSFQCPSMKFATPLLMRPSLTYLRKTAAWLDRTFPRSPSGLCYKPSQGASASSYVVDLWRPWRYNTSRAKEITDQLWFVQDGDDTRRVNPFRPSGPRPPLRCRRFAYGYALDNSEFPCHLVWHRERSSRISYQILPRVTLSSWMRGLPFVSWVCNIFMIPLPWSFKYNTSAL